MDPLCVYLLILLILFSNSFPSISSFFRTPLSLLFVSSFSSSPASSPSPSSSSSSSSSTESSSNPYTEVHNTKKGYLALPVYSEWRETKEIKTKTYKRESFK
jgi:hypothetical protein